MSDDEREPADVYRPGAALPDPMAASGPTRWTEAAADYAGGADGTSPWADTPAAAVLLPEVEPVAERVGWLTAGRVAIPNGWVEPGHPRHRLCRAWHSFRSLTCSTGRAARHRTVQPG